MSLFFSTHCQVPNVKCCEEPDRSQDKMTGNTSAIEVIIPRLKGDSADLIPSVRGLGTPCLIQENVCYVLIIAMSAKHCRCSVSKTYKQQEKAGVHVLDFFPVLYICCNLYFPRQHESAFSPWKGRTELLQAAQEKRGQNLKLTHHESVTLPLVSQCSWEAQVGPSQLEAACCFSPKRRQQQVLLAVLVLSQPPFCSPCTTQFRISHHRVWRAAYKTQH